MEINRSEGLSGPGRVEGPRYVTRVPPSNVAPSLGTDRVEISEAARLSSALARLPEVRLEKIRNLRDLISRGEYESEEKFRVAVERFLEEIGAA